MSEWKEIELGKLCQIKGGKRLPKGEQLSETITEHPYIRTRDLANNKIALQNLLFVPNNVFPKISRYIVEEGEIIISIVGTIGLVARIPKELHLASLTENCAKLVGINQKMIDKGFLFYFLLSDEGQDEIDQRNVGSTQPKLPLYNIKSIPIPIPPLPEQKSIASILSSLDDKIDLLHRQNATLEKMAETLFRQGFIEDAKEEWQMGKVSDYAIHFKDSIQPQKTPQTFYFHYSIPSFDNEKNPIKELGQEIQSNKYKVPEFCILFSKLNPHKDKRVWLLQNEVGANAVCSTEFQIVLPKSKQHLYFLYGWLTLNENYNEIASGVDGTSTL